MGNPFTSRTGRSTFFVWNRWHWLTVLLGSSVTRTPGTVNIVAIHTGAHHRGFVSTYTILICVIICSRKPHKFRFVLSLSAVLFGLPLEQGPREYSQCTAVRVRLRTGGGGLYIYIGGRCSWPRAMAVSPYAPHFGGDFCARKVTNAGVYIMYIIYTHRVQ